MSDELTIIQPNDQMIIPNPRPISLKNQSIDIVKSISAPTRFSAIVEDTIKGTVAHLTPPKQGVFDYEKKATPALIVYPKSQRGVNPFLKELSKGESFLRLADNSFNYSTLGTTGFRCLADLHEQVECFEYSYDGDFEQALELLDSLLPS